MVIDGMRRVDTVVVLKNSVMYARSTADLKVRVRTAKNDCELSLMGVSAVLDSRKARRGLI